MLKRMDSEMQDRLEKVDSKIRKEVAEILDDASNRTGLTPDQLEFRIDKGGGVHVRERNK